MKNQTFKYSFLIIACIVGEVVLFSNASAAELLTTWEARSYVPPTYIGRAFPNRNSVVQMSVNVVEGDSVVDISKNKIIWVVNGKDVQSGVGLQTITFVANRAESQKVDVTVQNYNKENIARLVIIPTVEPEIALDLPSFGQTIPKTKIRVGALPYFFNIASLNDLLLTWETPGAKITNTAAWISYVDIDASNQISGGRLTISVQAENQKVTTERIIKNITLTFE